MSGRAWEKEDVLTIQARAGITRNACTLPRRRSAAGMRRWRASPVAGRRRHVPQLAKEPAASFGVVLGAFLLGLAAGSFASWGTCRLRPATGDARHLRIPAALLLLGSVQAFLVIPALAWIVRTSSFSHALPLISVAAASQGAVLPLLSQFGIRPDADAGARLSYLYVANILGSVSGSLLTGFVLLDRLSLTQVSRLMALLGIGLATALFAVSRPRARAFAAWGAIAGISACSVVASTPSLYSSLYEKLQFKHDYDPGARAPSRGCRRPGRPGAPRRTRSRGRRPSVPQC